LLFGLGGEHIRGACHVDEITIAMQYFMVQFSMDLHRRTVEEVRKL
jgi:hypothetical protein